jgi:hypothetical protein
VLKKPLPPGDNPIAVNKYYYYYYYYYLCADCLKIWELQPAGTLRTCPGL